MRIWVAGFARAAGVAENLAAFSQGDGAPPLRGPLPVPERKREQTDRQTDGLEQLGVNFANFFTCR